jgi:hypothetical protein
MRGFHSVCVHVQIGEATGAEEMHFWLEILVGTEAMQIMGSRVHFHFHFF